MFLKAAYFINDLKLLLKTPAHKNYLFQGGESGIFTSLFDKNKFNF